MDTTTEHKPEEGITELDRDRALLEMRDDIRAIRETMEALAKMGVDLAGTFGGMFGGGGTPSFFGGQSGG